MEAAFRAGVAVIVLDRPNPLGGVAIEGGTRRRELRVVRRAGRGSGPPRADDRRGGALADGRDAVGRGAVRAADRGRSDRRADARLAAGDELRRGGAAVGDAVAQHADAGDRAGLPGQCLFEATNLSEGRGTTRPFEIVGAPFLDGYDWVAALSGWRAKSCRCRASAFARCRSGRRSTSSPAARAAACSCTSPTGPPFDPTRPGSRSGEARRLAPAEFRWRTEPYEFVADPPAIDLLTGAGTCAAPSTRMRSLGRAGRRLRPVRAGVRRAPAPGVAPRLSLDGDARRDLRRELQSAARRAPDGRALRARDGRRRRALDGPRVPAPVRQGAGAVRPPAGDVRGGRSGARPARQGQRRRARPRRREPDLAHRPTLAAGVPRPHLLAGDRRRSAREVPTWHDGEELQRTVPFIVVGRAGFERARGGWPCRASARPKCGRRWRPGGRSTGSSRARFSITSQAHNLYKKGSHELHVRS